MWNAKCSSGDIMHEFPLTDIRFWAVCIDWPSRLPSGWAVSRKSNNQSTGTTSHGRGFGSMCPIIVS